MEVERKMKIARTTDQATATRCEMAVVLRGSPPGFDWGWFSREDPRMHLQVLDEEHCQFGYKVWLERKGKRIVEPAGKIPAKILKKLEPKIAAARATIESKWTNFMIRKGWLKLRVSVPVTWLASSPALVEWRPEGPDVPEPTPMPEAQPQSGRSVIGYRLEGPESRGGRPGLGSR